MARVTEYPFASAWAFASVATSRGSLTAICEDFRFFAPVLMGEVSQMCDFGAMHLYHTWYALIGGDKCIALAYVVVIGTAQDQSGQQNLYSGDPDARGNGSFRHEITKYCLRRRGPRY